MSIPKNAANLVREMTQNYENRKRTEIVRWKCAFALYKKKELGNFRSHILLSIKITPNLGQNYRKLRIRGKMCLCYNVYKKELDAFRSQSLLSVPKITTNLNQKFTQNFENLKRTEMVRGKCGFGKIWTKSRRASKSSSSVHIKDYPKFGSKWPKIT